MNESQFLEDDDRLVRRYEYDDETVIAADIGPADEASIDVLDDVAIIVVGDGDDAAQYELELPDGGGAQGFIKNGVVTIEVRQ